MKMEVVMEMDVSVSGRFMFRDASHFVGRRWGWNKDGDGDRWRRMEISGYFFRRLLALPAASDLRWAAWRAGTLVNFFLRPLEETTTALLEELLEEFAPDGDESLTPTQGAMQESVDCESLTPTQGAMQQSVDWIIGPVSSITPES